jgi:hypothetical protein
MPTDENTSNTERNRANDPRARMVADLFNVAQRVGGQSDTDMMMMNR